MTPGDVEIVYSIYCRSIVPCMLRRSVVQWIQIMTNFGQFGRVDPRLRSLWTSAYLSIYRGWVYSRCPQSSSKFCYTIVLVGEIHVTDIRLNQCKYGAVLDDGMLAPKN